jgi:type IV secretory pathway TrbD component
MLFSDTVAVYCENHMEHTNALCGQNAELFLMLNHVVCVCVYCHLYQWLQKGFGLVTGFINNLQVVTTNNYYTIADLHNLQSLHTNLSLCPLIFTIRFLATDL